MNPIQYPLYQSKIKLQYTLIFMLYFSKKEGVAMKLYTQEEKQQILKRYESGEAVNFIAQETQIPRSTIYGWIHIAKE